MTAAMTDAPIIELEDSWESINEWFLAHDLTDGLPIVPPTEARVAAMTDYVERTLGWQAADVIGTLAPKQGLATVEKIAANAVMAGCMPEYMPVLLACVKAVADRRNSISTPCRPRPTTHRRCPSSTARCARRSI